jgi:peptidoglycan/xylan/chitin deacetylase (PgdA/CDA1 family)
MNEPGCEWTPPAQNANRAVMRRKTCCYYKHGRRSERTVALTFDDGPNPPRTEQILAILRDAGVKATFFVMGKWAERFPDTVRRMVAEGHLVGNHGYGGERQLGDADEAEAVIGHITGQPCHYLRAHCFNYAAFFNAEVIIELARERETLRPTLERVVA